MNHFEDYKAQQAARDVAAKALQAANQHLVAIGGKNDSLVAAAKNIRIELAAAFPGVKFGVKSSRFSGGDSISVRWIDGPVAAQVDAIIDRYSAGNFDGMTDCYNYERNAWRDAFGDAKYVQSNRGASDKAIASAIRTVFAKYAGNLKGIAKPSADEYNSGRLWNVMVEGLNDNLSSLIGVCLHRRCWMLTQRAARIAEAVAA